MMSRRGKSLLLSAASELSVVSGNLMKSGRDLRGYVQDAQRAVRDRVTLPSGYRLIWTSQYEHLARAEERLKLVVPVTSGIILFATLSQLRFAGEIADRAPVRPRPQASQ